MSDPTRSPATLADLLALLAKLPDGGMVTVAWIREQLQAVAPEPAGEPEVFTVPDLARRWRRGASTVRTLLERGEIGAAYRHRGREWCVPRAAVLTYEAHQQQEHAPKPGRRGKRPTSCLEVAREKLAS